MKDLDLIIIIMHNRSRHVHDVSTAYVITKEKMASVAEMYDVGWEGKIKYKIATLQVSHRHVFLLFESFWRYLAH